MEIENNSNISSLIASSISKLNLNVSGSAASKQQAKNHEQNSIKENLDNDVNLTDEEKISKTPIDVKDVQKYASLIGEDLTVEEINYGLMYGRSVIADFSA